jgi:hypothetical protein
MVKLRAPDGISSIVHDGVEVPIGDDRSVEVDDRSAEVFYVHGFRPWNGGTDTVPIDAAPHSHMVWHLLEPPGTPSTQFLPRASWPACRQRPPVPWIRRRRRKLAASTNKTFRVSIGGRFSLSSERRESRCPCPSPMKNYAPRRAAHFMAERSQTIRILTALPGQARF